MKHREIIASEGWVFIAVTALLAVAFGRLSFPIPAAVFTVVSLFCVFFFRNPPRVSPPEEGLVVSPADGKVMEISRGEEPLFIEGEAICVRIFLSLCDVHVNRMPVAGQIIRIHRVAGRFLPAYKQEAAWKNQRNYVGIHSDEGRVLVVQISGLAARRLVCWVKVGERLDRGERLGLIRFGSCTELYLPGHADVQVKPGERVRGGKSIVAKF